MKETHNKCLLCKKPSKCESIDIEGEMVKCWVDVKWYNPRQNWGATYGEGVAEDYIRCE